MLPYQLIAGGSFVASASVNRQQIQVSDKPDFIWVRNRTDWGDASASTSVESWWRQGMAQNAAQTSDQAVTTNILSSNVVTSNGFRVYNTTEPPVFAALAGTAISKANPAVVLMTNTGSIQVGDVVKTIDPLGMLQIGGYDFEVTAVSANTSITLNLDSSAQATAATTNSIQLYIPSRFFPRWRYIVPLSGSAGITQAAQCVVSFSVTHDFSVGEYVSFRVPSQFGMSEINNQKGIVQAVTQYTITVAIDTSGFTAFTLPASTVVASNPFSPAIVVPAGSGPTPNGSPPGVSVKPAFDNRNEWLIDMGSSIITGLGDTYDWMAMKYDTFNGS